MSAGSKTDPPVLESKAESISGGGECLWDHVFKEGEKNLHNCRWKREVPMWKSNNSADTKISGEGEGRDAPGAGAEIPCSPQCSPWCHTLCPCSPWRSMIEQRFTSSPQRTPCQSRWMPEGGSDPMGSLHWRRICGRMEKGDHTVLLTGLVTLLGTNARVLCS
ncbi:hypothetical protein WISP_137780 [Willisornis vidua]|uniref:Uncharacterized protein n=1 Tax=Willisornis vidua TaxID=1566151 RepID=A0ABQ9CTM2_9PASS|nr:hypothetical protein WISP_137780 [Willisornis vidua]